MDADSLRPRKPKGNELSIDLYFAADRVNHWRTVRRSYADLGLWREG